MAKELRHETLIATGTTATANSQAEFRNDSSSMIHIRELDDNLFAVAVTPADELMGEISKASAAVGRTPNTPFFTVNLIVTGPPTGATPADGSISVVKIKKYARGQLTLEPGESLFMHSILLTGAPTWDHFCHIAYEF